MGNGNINNVILITENFNNYFTKVLSKLARDIDTSSVNFDKYVSKCNITLPECPVNINELKDPCFSPKTHEIPRYNKVSFNIVKHCFHVLQKPLLHIPTDTPFRININLIAIYFDMSEGKYWQMSTSFWCNFSV